MKMKLFRWGYLITLSFLTVSFLTSCNSDKKIDSTKSEKTKITAKSEENIKVDSSIIKKSEKEVKEKTDSSVNVLKEKVKKEVKEKLPILTGLWKGKFDKRATSLKIISQKGNLFTGKISINYRQQINQKVSGSINPSTLEMKMTDLLHSRYQGSYKGKLSKDLKKYTGTFTMKLDGKKFNFNLTKQ